MPQTNRKLAQISAKIKALEKKTIQNVIEIGKLLHEASEQCEHGEYRVWLRTEFSWSHDTARNYRSIYTLDRKTKFSSFAKFDISISALYLVAANLTDDKGKRSPGANAVIKAATKGRVSYRMAHDIIKKQIALDAPLPSEPPDPSLPITPKTEKAYTALIQQRQLYEGACSLPWQQYFEYRDLHPDDCTPLTPDDLAYASQWTSYAVSPDDEESPLDEVFPPDDTEEEPLLLVVMNDLLGITERDPAWSAVIADIGPASLLRIIEMFQMVYDKHCDGNATDRKVKAAADRAEAKTQVH